MGTVEVRVCDVQARPGEPVAEYVIVADERPRRLDLCEERARPLRALLASACEAVDGSEGQPTPRRTRRTITTLAEIEELKRKGS